MSYTRHLYQAILVLMFMLQTCFGQFTCFPLDGGDTHHPNGLFVQLVAKKQYTGPRQNSSPTYIYQISNAGQVLWDATQGAHGISSLNMQTAVRSELNGCIPVPATPPTTPPQSLPFYYTPLSTASQVMAVADFNRDGFADAAVVLPGTNQLAVYLGNPDGTFQAPVNSTVGTATTRLTSIALADFNSDRKLDLAVVDSVNNAVIVLFGKGDGTFVMPLTVPVGHGPGSITVGDVNNDGQADFAVTNSADNTVSVVRGNGDGTFVPGSAFAVGKNPVSVIIQDLNKDGNPDVIVADNGSNDIAVLFGLGNGGFQNAVLTKTPLPPTFLASADFTDDGLPDVVALATDANAVMMLVGNFQGKLTLAGSFLVPNLTASLSVNDFDGDGYLDVLVTDTDTGSTVLLLGRGDGTLNAPAVYGASSGLTSLATADFNGDGKADLLLTGVNATTSTLSFLAGLGTGQFQAPVNIPVSGRTDVIGVGDFNRDGRPDIAVSGAQLNILLNQGNATFQQGAQYPNLAPSIVTDLNKDGRPDIAGPFNGALGLMLGNGDGTFRPATSFAVGSNPVAAVSADFNKDSNPDIAVLNAGTAGSTADPGGLSILIGNGTGSFAAAVNIPAGQNPKALAAADVNLDGKPDLIVATGITGGGYQISVFLGKGDGTFLAPLSVPYPAGETPNTIALTDLDGDGNPDIVIGDCCGDSTSGYFRGNGDGTFQPLLAFYSGNNVKAIAVGDWNGDGKPDLAMAASPSNVPTVSAVTAHINHLSSSPAMAITSGASFLTGPMAPDSIVTLFGNNLTTDTAAATGDPSMLPTILKSTSVTVQDSKGVSRLAQLYYVSPTQINFLAPAATEPSGMAKVIVNAPNGVTAASVLSVKSVPGIFTVNSGGLAAGNGVHVQSGVQSIFNLSYYDPVAMLNLPIPVYFNGKTDQVFLTLFGTGFRNRTSLDRVTVQIGNQFGAVSYAGPQPQFPGLDQVNFQVPQALAGSGQTTILVTVDGVAANPVNITIQ